MKIEKSLYTSLSQVKNIQRFDIINNNGLRISLLNYGAAWIDTVMPDLTGNLSSIMMINKGLIASSFLQFLHSREGLINIDLSGFCFATETGCQEQEAELVFTHCIRHRQQDLGQIKLSYLFNNENQLIVSAHIICYEDSYLNFGLMPQFNLLGDFTLSVASHRLMINAYKYLSFGDEGHNFVYSLGLPIDFSKGAPLSRLINTSKEGIHVRYLINKEPERWAALGKCVSEESGRVIEFVSNQALLQLDSQAPYHSLCLSPQALTPLSPLMPKVYCTAGNGYTFRSRYTFTTIGKGHKH